MFEPTRTTVVETVAEVTIKDEKITDKSKVATVATVKYQIKQPNEYSDDFMVTVRASDLRRVQQICNAVKNTRICWYEILLAIGTTSIGCILSAIVAKIKLNSSQGIIYLICSIVATATIVSYFFVRKSSMQNANELAKKVTEYLVNPDEIKEEK